MTVTPRTSIPSAGPRLGRPRRIAVVGGGASGTLTALNVLRTTRQHVAVTVFEPRGRLGCGIAYSTTDRRHLLNVPAGNMSAFPEAPGDLVCWAEATGRAVGADGFLPRADYAHYLRQRLEQISGHRPGCLTTVGEAVIDLLPVGPRFLVRTSSTEGEYDVVVLAHGNAAPSRLAVGDRPLPAAPWHVPDPWDLSWVGGLGPEATVVLVGTGLTAVDTAITILDDAPRRRVVMVSRHGLLPRAHPSPPATSTEWVTPVPAGTLTADGLAALVRREIRAAASRQVDWRAVVDGLRGSTASIWARLDQSERRRFLDRYAREWEVRRHRMAPEVAARLDGYRAEGRLEVVGGGLTAIRPDIDDRDRVDVELAGRRIVADAVVNCTGPLLDLDRTDNPLLTTLRRRGLLAPDPLHLGLSCTPAGVVLDADGCEVPGLLTVGPPRKGVLFETTAIPEIRVQAAEVAALVLASR